MPEARDRRARTGRGDLPLGFGIQGFNDAATGRNVSGRTTAQIPFDDKENIPPGSSRPARRRRRSRRTMLPSWYPRTPLRDITSIVNAMERKQARVREHARHRPRNPEAENSPPPNFESPLSNIPDPSPDPVDEIKPFQKPATNLIETDSLLDDLTVHRTPVKKKKPFDFDEAELLARENSQRRVAQRPEKKNKSVRSTLMSMR